MQSKLAKLQQYCDRINNGVAARAITVADVADVIDVIACIMLKDKHTAEKFCYFMWSIAYYAESPGCDVILQAGGIPVLFDCLRSWPREKDVVSYACWASSCLADWGSETVNSAMRSVPDCEALLIAAHKSSLDDRWAAPALKALGFKKPCCAIM
jgi:hypothetical protein